MQLLSISFDYNYLPLLAVLFTAWLVPVLLSSLKLSRIPTVIAEIIAGFLLGRYLLHPLQLGEMRSLEMLALSGFLFLMFLSGLEINVDQIRASLPRRKITYSRFLANPLLVGVAIFAISLLLSFLGTLLLDRIIEVQNILYFSLIMVTTSVGIILPVLKNRGESHSRFGQMIILAAAVADIFSIILFSFTAFIIKNGFRPELFLIIGLFITFYLFRKMGLGLAKIQFFHRLTYKLSHAASQIQVRGTLLVIAIFVVLSQYIGEEIMLLGAFLAGILLSGFLHRGRSILMIKLDGIGYGFFIPIFFIMVGVQFQPSTLNELDKSIFLYLLVLAIILFAVKVIPSLLWSRLFGYKKAIAGGFLMASRLSLIIAASKIGLDMGILSPGLNSCFILMAVLTCLTSPVIYNQLNPLNILKGDKVIIVGGSSSGVLLARRLKLHGKAAVIIESDKTRYLDLLAKGLNAYLGSGVDLNTYEKVHLKNNNYVVILTGNDKKDLAVARLLRSAWQHEKIITKSSNQKMDRQLMQMGVEYLDPTRMIASTIENLILRPLAYHTLIDSFDNFTVEEMKIRKPEFETMPVRNIPFHRDGALMLVRKENQIIIPHGDTVLEKGDVATVLGTETAMEDFRHLFEE